MGGYNKYLNDERTLLSRLFALPKLANLDGFLYYYFKSQIERNNGMPDERRERLNIINYTYTSTNEETHKLNNGEFEHIVKNAYYRFHNWLREFFISNHNFHDIEMIKTFSRAIYFLKDYDKLNAYNQGRVVNENLNRNYFLSIIKQHITELISELEWRINRLDPLNYKIYNPSDKEIKRYFDSIITKGLVLRNRKKFDENFENIYSSLVPKYFSQETSKEDFNKMFSNKNEIFTDNIQWVTNTNLLCYFLRKLNDKHKLANGRFFVFAEKIIVNQDGESLSKLKDTKSHPSRADEIDSIIDLF